MWCAHGLNAMPTVGRARASPGLVSSPGIAGGLQMRSKRRHVLLLPLLAVFIAGFASRRAPFNKQRVSFKSGNLTLVGYAYHPDGRGPFPTIIWNHGSEPNPGGGPQFDAGPDRTRRA